MVCIYTIIKTTSVGDARLSMVGVAGWLVILMGWTTGRWRWAWSKLVWLSGRGARVYTAHRGWLGVVTDISAASTGGILVCKKIMAKCLLKKTPQRTTKLMNNHEMCHLLIQCRVSVWQYLQVSCRHWGTSWSGSEDSASSAPCSPDIPRCPRTRKPSCSAPSAWKTLDTSNNSSAPHIHRYLQVSVG